MNLFSVVSFLSLLYFASQVNSQIVFGCAKEFCSRQLNSCPDLQCKYGRVVKNATQCGCCHICVYPLEEGDPCTTLEVARIPRLECGPGLQCDKTTHVCKPGSTTCTYDLAKLKDKFSGDELTTGEPMPRCDQFGYYEPVQCKAGMVCYCVDRDGRRIFGTSPFTQEESIDCACSRDYEEMKLSGNSDEDRETNFLRCDAYGNYDETQCTEDECYCLKDGEQSALPSANRNWDITQLPCYDSRRHGPSFKTPCIVERENILKEIRDAKNRGVLISGLEPPVCEPDGTYAPKQCQKDQCYCVDRNGNHYYKTVFNTLQVQYVVPRYSEAAQNMLCNCEREKELFKTMHDDKRTDIFASYKCDKNGNYLPMQCTTNVCYCVNENGFQEDDAARIIADIEELTKCYKQEYLDILGILD